MTYSFACTFAVMARIDLGWPVLFNQLARILSRFSLDFDFVQPECFEPVAPELKWLAGVDGKSDLEVDRFECGVCGGSAGGCPACGGFETPNAGSITEDKSELEAGRFECGVCGGSGGGCPACGSPIFELVAGP